MEYIIQRKWKNAEIRCALLILRDLSWLFPYLNQVKPFFLSPLFITKKSWTKIEFFSSQELAFKVVSTSCTFVTNVLSKLDSAEGESLVLIGMEVCLRFVTQKNNRLHGFIMWQITTCSKRKKFKIRIIFPL